MSASVVDEIREQLERPEVSVESMERLAELYSQEVEKVNQRLAVCSKLLERGRRSDAVQQAAMRPPLIEWCSRLDFPELVEWLEILQFIQATVPAPVNLEAVGQLREALVDDQPIEELLLQQRRLAIGKAPIAWRLNILRRLSVIDSGNAIWREDVEIFEKARMREIQSEFNNAAKANNYDLCRALASELTNKSWQSAPPTDLLKQVCATTDRLQREVQCSELRIIASAMYSAFCAQEDAKCRAQRTRWQALLRELKEPPPSEIVESAEPALVWLGELDNARAAKENHLRAVSQLTEAIKKSESIRAIQTAYETAASHGMEISSEVETGYLAALSTLRARSRRRTITYTSGTIAATIIGIVSFGFWQSQRAHKQDTSMAVAAMQEFLQNGKLEEANKYWEQLKTSRSKVAASMEIKPLVSDLESRLKTESERRVNFETQIQNADQAIAEKIDLLSLERAEKLAVTPIEKDKAKAIRLRRSEFDRVLAERELQSLKNEAAELTKNIDEWESTVANKLQEGELVLALSKIDDFRKQYTKGSASTLLDELESRTKAIQVVLVDEKKAIENERLALARIRGAKTFESLAVALGDFQNQAPKSQLGAKFATVSKEAAIWQRALEWNDLASSVGSYLRARENKQTLETKQPPLLLEQISKIQASFSDTSKLASIKPVQETLEKIRERNNILTKLRSELAEDQRSKVVMIVGSPFENDDQQIRLFALPDEIKKKTKVLNSPGVKAIDVLSDLDGNTKGQSFKRAVVVYEHPKVVFDKLFKWFDEKRDNFLVDWEIGFLHYSNKLCSDEIDHKIKEFLIHRLLKSGIEGSSLLADFDKKHSLVAKLESRAQDSWFESSQLQTKLDDDVNERVRTPLRELLDQLIKTPSLANRSLEPLARSRLNWIGIVDQNEEGRPTVASNPQITDGSIFILKRSPNDEAVVQPIQVGSAREGRVIFDGDKNELVFGRPLFFNPSVVR